MQSIAFTENIPWVRQNYLLKARNSIMVVSGNFSCLETLKLLHRLSLTNRNIHIFTFQDNPLANKKPHTEIELDFKSIIPNEISLPECFIIDNRILMISNISSQTGKRQTRELLLVQSENFDQINEILQLLHLLSKHHNNPHPVSQSITSNKLISRLQALYHLSMIPEEYNAFCTQKHNILQLLQDKSTVSVNQQSLLMSLVQTNDFTNAIEVCLQTNESVNQLISRNETLSAWYQLQSLLQQVIIHGLQSELAELHKNLHHFNTSYNKILGHLNLRILQLRYQQREIELAKMTAAYQNNPNEYQYQRFQESQELFEEATEDFRQYRSGFHDIFQVPSKSLNPEESREIKAIFYQAARLCHPDIVPENCKPQAEAIFKDLSYAYQTNHLAQVKSLFQELQQGKITLQNRKSASQQLTSLQTAINKQALAIRQLTEEIWEIRTSETYSILEHLSDWETYFEEKKTQLLSILNKLESELTPHV